MNATLIDLAPLCAIPVGPWYADPLTLYLVLTALGAFALGWLLGQWSGN